MAICEQFKATLVGLSLESHSLIFLQYIILVRQILTHSTVDNYLEQDGHILKVFPIPFIKGRQKLKPVATGNKRAIRDKNRTKMEF